MKYLISAGISVIFGIVGTSISSQLLGAGPWVAWVAVVATMIGVVAGGLLAEALGRKRHVTDTLPRPRFRLAGNPRPFEQRLDRFSRSVARPGSAAPRVEHSRMPFWSARVSYQQVPPKSPAYIRRILQRIRSILRRATAD